MKAMVMAAGIGTRLRPLTYNIPKPMIPIANRPVLEYTLRLLEKHKINEVMINLHTKPEMIMDYFKDGSFCDIKIKYSQEDQLMGTAGGVKKAEHFFDGDFLVMSGDGLTDIDLTKVIEFHRKKKALATMVLKKIDTKFEYGVTLLDEKCRIKKFIEKPMWSDVFTNTVNTGIYVFQKEIFKFIPENKFYDFGNQVWPLLLELGEKIFGYVMNEYWCDIGNLSEYRRAQKDVLEKKVKIDIPGEEIKKNVWVGEGAEIEDNVEIIAPCLIGKRCQIKSGAHIGPFTIIGKDSSISKDAILENCILLDEVFIDKNVELKNCIVGNYANVSENISVFDGSIIEKIKR